MTYEELPQEMREQIEMICVKRRNVVREIIRVIRDADVSLFVPRAIVVEQYVRDNLDAGEVIPNRTGLAGAMSLTKERWLTLAEGLTSAMSILTQIQTTDPLLLSDAIGIESK